MAASRRTLPIKSLRPSSGIIGRLERADPWVLFELELSLSNSAQRADRQLCSPSTLALSRITTQCRSFFQGDYDNTLGWGSARGSHGTLHGPQPGLCMGLCMGRNRDSAWVATQHEPLPTRTVSFELGATRRSAAVLPTRTVQKQASKCRPLVVGFL